MENPPEKCLKNIEHHRLPLNNRSEIQRDPRCSYPRNPSAKIRDVATSIRRRIAQKPSSVMVFEANPTRKPNDADRKTPSPDEHRASSPPTTRDGTHQPPLPLATAAQPRFRPYPATADEGNRRERTAAERTERRTWEMNDEDTCGTTPQIQTGQKRYVHPARRLLAWSDPPDLHRTDERTTSRLIRTRST